MSNNHANFLKAFDEGRVVSFTWPGSGDLQIGLERHMIDDAMQRWAAMDAGDRASAMASVRRAMKRTTKRLKQNRAKPAEMDALAADIALFVGHELIYADGEKWMVKNPPRSNLETYQ